MPGRTEPMIITADLMKNKEEIVMTKLPLSDFVWDYYQSQGITFTDSEQATIIWNSHLSRTEMLSALQEIAERTDDEALKTQLQERLAAEAESERELAEDSEGYLYIFEPDDTDKWEQDFFSTLESAVAYGKEHSGKTFKITKVAFGDKVDQCLKDSDGNKIVCVYAEYTTDGTLTECTSHTEGISFSICGEQANRFEEAYIPLENPFKPGDIVRMIGNSTPAVVEYTQAQWDEKVKRMHKFSSYDNTRLPVLALYEDGVMCQTIWYILSLEKIDTWEDPLEWNVLQSASKLIKGEGTLEDFLYYYHENIDQRKEEPRQE